MRILLIILFSMVLPGCDPLSQAPQVIEPEGVSSAQKAELIQPSSTIKPGAAVLFSTNFAGPLEVGERAALVIELTPRYDSGQIEVEIQPEAGLSLIGQTRYSERFSGAYQFSRQLEVGADAAGEYSLSVVVNVVTDTGLNEARAFTETILVENGLSLPEVKMNSLIERAGESSEEDKSESYLPAVEQIIN